MKPMSPHDIRAFPPLVSLLTAAGALGIGRSRAYRLARAGSFPCPVHRVGRLYKVKTADILAHLTHTSAIPPADDRRRGRQGQSQGRGHAAMNDPDTAASPPARTAPHRPDPATTQAPPSSLTSPGGQSRKVRDD